MLLEGAVARVKAWRQAPLPAGIRTAARIAGVLVLLALVGAFLSAACAFAQAPGPATAPLTIERALELAASRNEGLKGTRERLSEREAAVAEARAAYLPTFDFNYLFTPVQESPILRIPAGAFSETEQTFRFNLTRVNVLRFDLSQALYTGGRLSHAYGAQAAGREGSRLEVERAQQGLTLRVYETFYAALTADQGVRVTTEGVSIAERHLELAQVRFDAGSAARLDVLRAEVELANARAKLIRARSAASVAYQSVRSVLSLPQDEPLQLSGSLDEAPALPDTTAIRGAMANRPDIRAIGQQREAAVRLASLASAERKPTIALSGNVQYQEDGVGSLFDGASRSYQFGLAVRVPLFNAPTVDARRSAATARVRQAEHGINAALDGARLELATASTELDAAREIVSTQQKAVELAREGLSIAEVSYENGVITATELNDARLSLLETEWELMQAKYGQIVAAARTRYAAGL
jgi:outer membrane protein TolC